MSKLIIITGTPGTGKSTLAKVLAQKLKYRRVNLHRYYKQLSVSYNTTKQCYDIDLKKFHVFMKEQKRKYSFLIVDSHISHFLPKRMVDFCIVLTCSNLKTLKKRLEQRKYSSRKVRENLDAEIFQVCLSGATEKKHRIFLLDSSQQLNISLLLQKIRKSL
ncbi:MAG: AAA family ATPase [Nanoarchaeota archaeon]